MGGFWVRWKRYGLVLFLLVLVVLMLLFLFGIPKLSFDKDGWDINTYGGFLTIQVWSDHYAYGAMILEEEEVENQGSQVMWWIRFEWFKKK